MELNMSTAVKLRILLILSWAIFIGVCIDAGTFLVSVIVGVVNPGVVRSVWLWQNIDLSALAANDRWHFITITSIIAIVGIIKALMFYLIIKVLHNKELDLDRPFTSNFGRFVFNLAYLSLFAGLFSYWGVRYIEWVADPNNIIPAVSTLRLGSADVWLFMGVVLLVIAQIFKRGIELQSENDLTV